MQRHASTARKSRIPVGPGAHNLLARIVIDNDGVDITVIVDEPDIVLGLKLESGFPWRELFSTALVKTFLMKC